jgi:hypothetical protein
VRLRVLQCPRCGAPLPKRAALVKVVCEYCKSEVVLERYVVKASEYHHALIDYLATDATDQLEVAGVPYRLKGRLAVGHSSDVWLAERATRLSERVVIKRLRNAEDHALLEHEQAGLRDLERSTERGCDYFATLLPQRAAFGQGIRSGSTPVLSAVFREPTGFAHTLLDVQRAFPNGGDPRHLVWIWRRVLELLSWVHRSGKVHAAVLPAHVLLNAPDHAARLVGWACAARIGARLSVAAAADLDVYPQSELAGGPISAGTDLVMTARTLLKIFGQRVDTAPAHFPPSLAKLLEREAGGTGDGDAGRLQRRGLPPHPQKSRGASSADRATRGGSAALPLYRTLNPSPSPDALCEVVARHSAARVRFASHGPRAEDIVSGGNPERGF